MADCGCSHFPASLGNVTFDPGVNVGVGTSSPAYALHVGLGAILQVEGPPTSNSVSYFSMGGNGAFGIDAQGLANGRFVVPDGGRVGVDTPSPQALLHVSGAGSAVTLRLETATAGATDTALSIKTPDREYKLGQDVGGIGVGKLNLWDITAGANRLTVDTQGNVGIGTGSPAYLLDVAGVARVSGVLLVGQDVTLNGAINRSTGGKIADQGGCYYAN